MSISLDAVELTPRTANLQPYQSEWAHITADHASTNEIIQDYVFNKGRLSFFILRGFKG